MESVKTINSRIEIDSKSTLGEGAFWNHQDGKLWWVDIEGKILHIYNPESGKNKSIPVGQRIGTVVPAERGGAIVALQNGIFHLDLKTEVLTLINNPLKDISNIRFNDGKCDPSGRLWVGSMELNTKEGAASLYRLDTDGKVTEMIRNITISNGLAWSKDAKTMFYIDTHPSTIMSYRFNNETGEISDEKIVVKVPEEMGSPDGMTIDAEDKLWAAHYGGHGVYRWDPETGDLMEKITLPAPNVTSCAFGGKNLEDLYITTAREGLDDEQLKKYPLSGGVFKAKPGVRGVPFAFYKG